MQVVPRATPETAMAGKIAGRCTLFTDQIRNYVLLSLFFYCDGAIREWLEFDSEFVNLVILIERRSRGAVLKAAAERHFVKRQYSRARVNKNFLGLNHRRR